MRTISIQELEERPDAVMAEVEAGHRLTLIEGGKTIGDLVAHRPRAKQWASEEERLAELDHVMAKISRGYNLGGFKITDRDALYDRD